METKKQPFSTVKNDTQFYATVPLSEYEHYEIVAFFRDKHPKWSGTNALNIREFLFREMKKAGYFQSPTDPTDTSNSQT
jgi:hypothetical protein